MKLLILLFLISCGANDEYKQHRQPDTLSGDLIINNYHSLKFITEELTAKSVFRRFLSSSKKNFFNNPENMVLRFQDKQFSILEEETFSLNLNVENLHFYNLYFNDQGQDILMPRGSFTLNKDEIERILKNESFLYLKSKFNLDRGDVVFDGKTVQYSKTFPPLDSRSITLEEILVSEESDHKEWFHRETPFGELIFIFTSKKELKKEFFKKYKRIDFEIARINGMPTGSIHLHHGTVFLKISSQQVINNISKYGNNYMHCRPSNVITSQTSRVPTSHEISRSLGLDHKEIIKEVYSAENNQIWVKIDSKEIRNLELLPAKDSFFYENKCDRKVLKNFEAKLSLKVETYIESEEY